MKSKFLGFNSTYVRLNGKNTYLEYPTFGEAVQNIENRTIDVTSVIQFLNQYYFLGDRSILTEVSRLPWMSKVNENSELEYFDLPKHGHNRFKSISEIATRFHDLVKTELINQIGDKRSIGILLSGGMDSRIVAVILNELSQNELSGLKVTGINWGIGECRDKVYAARICDLYHWDLEYFELGPETLREAVDVTATNGVEFSPVHLHAMHKVAQLKNIDLILAGSYGDSVGRAEYSGSHLLNLKGLNKSVRNWFNLINKNAFNPLKEDALRKDVAKYRKLFSREEEYQYLEVERQAHYMRKMLNPCMGVINQHVRIFQAFTSPEVFGFMWSIDPLLRNDQMYYEFFQKYGKEIAHIPWARTGKPYFEEGSAVADNYSSLNNRYGEWVRKDLADELISTLQGDPFRSLSFINHTAINELLRGFNKHFTLPRRSKADEFLMWFWALAVAVEKYNLISPTTSPSFEDTVRGKILSPLELWSFSIYYKRKFR